MLLQQLNRADPEKVFVIAQAANISGVSANVPVCFDYSAAAASLGNAIASPATSNLGLFAGIVDADIAANAYGLVQAFGYRASIRVNVGGASVSAAGLLVGPAAALLSCQSNGRTFALGPIALFDNDLSGTVYAQGFIRAL